MHLISSLCSGLAAAANGHAELYIRDTSTRATWYASFEGDSPNSTGANITLDAYGAAEVYVNQLVDIVVKDDDGVTVRSFTDGYASPNIEVDSPSFTGTPYGGGGSAVSQPTTLQAVLDLWATNAGAPDWEVLFDGSAATLQTVLGGLTGLVYNVKSPEFGAAGDGVTNDQVAIQSALAAAVAAGGGVVFFPAGTYLVSTAIEWSHIVSVLGVGNGKSVITTSSAVNGRIFTFTSGTAQSAPQLFAGIALSSTATNSGTQLYCTVATNLRLVDVHFNVASTCVGTAMSVIGGTVSVERSHVVARGTSMGVYLGGDVVSSISNTKFSTTTPNRDNVAFVRLDDGSHTLTSNTFDSSGVTSPAAALYAIETVSTNMSARIVGNSFTDDTVPFSAAISVLSGSLVNASSNSFGDSPRYAVSGYPESGSKLEVGGYERVTGTSTSLTIPNGIDVWEFASSGTAPTVTMPTIYTLGQRLAVLVRNGSAGDWAGITFVGAEFYGTHDSSASIGQIWTGDFIAADIDSSGSPEWVCLSENLGS